MSKKRRANGTGSIFKRPDGRWEGKYFVGYDPKTGNPIRKSVYGKTQKEVKDKMLPFLSEISRGTYIPPSKITLEDWFGIWLRDYSCDKKWGTLKGYRASIYTHIVPVLGKYYLEDLTSVRVQMFYNGLSQPDENGVVLSPKSIRNIHIAFRAAMQQAVENDLIRRNPCHNAKLPKVYKTEVHPLSDDQVAQFLEMAKPDEQYGIVLRVILFTGLREGEALGLTWDCVDFAKGSITINKQLQRRPQHAGGTQRLAAGPPPRARRRRRRQDIRLRVQPGGDLPLEDVRAVPRGGEDPWRQPLPHRALHQRGAREVQLRAVVPR